MEILKVIWASLSGKKTTIGATLLIIAKVLTLIGQGEWADIITKIADLLNELGYSAITVGLADKGFKSLNK